MSKHYRCALRICTLLIVLLVCWPASAQVGRDWGTQLTTYKDPVTGVEVRELTKSPATSENLYYHFSNFTADNQYVIFSSTLDGQRHFLRADVETGRIVQLTDGAAIDSMAACPDHTEARRLYYLRNASVFAFDIEDFTLRKVGEIPPPRAAPYSQPTLSGDGKWMTLGKKLDTANWEIGLMNVDTGAYRTVITQGFPIGHVQHSPTDPIIFYVWETGGFAPQRCWLVNRDGTGNRPFYARTDPNSWITPLKEWITHEAWVWGTGEMSMINDKQGVMLVKKDGTARMVREGRYWHAAGSADGRFLVLDDFDGRLWLMEVATGNTCLLATGLNTSVKVHPHPSFDRNGDYVLFNSGRTHKTVATIDLRTLPDLAWR
jgi:oligogalacturonide lyase